MVWTPAAPVHCMTEVQKVDIYCVFNQGVLLVVRWTREWYPEGLLNLDEILGIDVQSSPITSRTSILYPKNAAVTDNEPILLSMLIY